MRPPPEPNAFVEDPTSAALHAAAEASGIDELLDLELSLQEDLRQLDEQKRQILQKYQKDRAAILEKLRIRPGTL